jgi:hypothetical protein
MAVKIQVEVFWVLTPCSVAVGYEGIGGPCCLHLQGEASGTSIQIHVMVFWVVTPCGDVVGYRSFGGPYCLHLQGEVSIIDILVSRLRNYPLVIRKFARW